MITSECKRGRNASRTCPTGTKWFSPVWNVSPSNATQLIGTADALTASDRSTDIGPISVQQAQSNAVSCLLSISYYFKI